MTTGIRKRHRKACTRPSSCSCPYEWTWESAADPGSGKRRQASRSGFTTAKAAKDDRAEYIRLHRGGPADRSLTVAQYLDAWLAGKVDAEQPIRATTARSYGQHIRQHLTPRLGRHRLADLTGQHIERAFTGLRKDRPDLSPATRARILATLRAALASAVKRDLIPSSPLDRTELRTRVDRPQVQPWTGAELGTFLDHPDVAGHRMYALFHVLAFTGLRRGEAAGLRWVDVDLDAGMLVVRQQRVVLGYKVEVGPPKTSNGANRVVHLDAATVAVLRTWSAKVAAERLTFGPGWADSGYVFVDEDGEPTHPERFGKTLGRLVKITGHRPIRLHDLRHGAASNLLNGGADMFAVSKMLGHSQATFTVDTYGHLEQQRARQLAEAAAAAVPRLAQS